MDATVEVYEELICSAARRLTGHQRRLFQAEVADALCNGSPRATERRFGARSKKGSSTPPRICKSASAARRLARRTTKTRSGSGRA